jgi:prepilin-type N-terminal cleavage/methylation domain-containing protein
MRQLVPSQPGRAPRRIAREESGFSLIELLVAATLLAGVLGGVLALLDTSQAIAPHDRERGHAVREAQVGVAAMTRELRTATELGTTEPYRLTALVQREGVATWVEYYCGGSAANPDWGQCVRTVMPGGTPAPLVRAFTNKDGSGGPPVFSYTTRPDGAITHVEVHVDVVVTDNASGRYGYRVPLTDGVYLRNLDG